MKLTKVLAVMALVLALPAAAFAANYAYVDTSGNVRLVEANDANTAIATAPSIARTSGVILLQGGLDSFFGNNGNNNSDNDSDDDMPEGESEEAAELRAGLRMLLGEHVELSLDVLRAIADEEDGSGDMNDVEDAMDRQDENSEEIAAAIGSIYGDAAGDDFLELFNEHVMASNDYTRAVAEGDDEAADEAYDELLEYLEEVTAFLAGANPNIDEDTLLAALTEHENLLNDASEAYIDGDEDESEELEDEAVDQIMGGADYLADAIIEQFPDRY